MEGSRDEYGGAKPDWAAKITGHCSRETTSDGRSYYQDDQPITPCHLKRTWWTKESIGTASGLWLQTGADGELLLPIVLSRTGGSK